MKKAFYQYFTIDTSRWFEERNVLLKSEADGRMFPVTDSSQTIIDCLMAEARVNNVQISINTEVSSLKPEAGKFLLELSDLRLLTSDFVCIACGGYNKASMFEWILQTGHTIEKPVPSLFTFNIPNHPLTQLMGIVVADAQVKIKDSKLMERGPILITHWG